jgi:hypothetical protein
LVWLGVLLLAIGGASRVGQAQSAPTGYVSVFADHLPNRDATELRARVFGQQTVEAGSRVRLVASGFLEGLVADRNGSVRDAIAEPQELMATIRTRRFDLAAGLGRVVWGRLDELQPTDVVNPLDVSRFFFEGRSEARLSVPLVRATLYAGEKALLAMIEQEADRADVLVAKVRFGGDLGDRVAALAERPNLSHQLDWCVVAPGEILNQAHDKTVFLRCFENNRRDLGLTERHEGFEAALAAHEVVP